MLGDSFLKYAVARQSFLSYEALDEGQLTRRRSGVVNNSNLYELAIAQNLQVTPFLFMYPWKIPFVFAIFTSVLHDKVGCSSLNHSLEEVVVVGVILLIAAHLDLTFSLMGLSIEQQHTASCSS